MKKEEKELYKIQREMNIRKILIIIFSVLLIIACIIIVAMYISYEGFRGWVDINVLRKNINSEDVAIIDLDTDKNNQICCYSRYIGILNDRNLRLYNSLGENISELSVDINTAIFASNDKYLAIAEKQGQEFCVILDKTYLWRGTIDGEILQIYINKNGYVAVVSTDTIHKSIITVYDSYGNQLLKNFLSSTRVVDVEIFNDNKYVAFAEMDTSGTLIQSNIKIISIEKVEENSEDSIVYDYQAEASKMIVNLQYQDKEGLVCLFNDSINIINNNEQKEILSINNDISFVSGNLTNYITYITEESTGIFDSKSILNIVNIQKNQQYIYNFEEIVKEMYTYNNIIGVNIGTEIYFINTSGLLLKKYTSKQEITNVLISNNLAIIIYKDRIEIIDL